MVIEQLGKATSEEKEILNILSEECAEVIQCISKIHRFGWDSVKPGTHEITNKDHFTEELGDLLCMISIVVNKTKIQESSIANAIDAKVGKLKNYSNIDMVWL